MTSRIERVLAAALCLVGLMGSASAQVSPIDIFETAGVPGTGGYSSFTGPCYCTEPDFYSPVMLLDPGTYDFGSLRDYWVPSGVTPDGGPDQPNVYLLFAPVETSGFYPDDFTAEAPYTFPAIAFCTQDDAACNASYQGASEVFDLIYTILPGQNAAQLGFFGNYHYISPVPEPSSWALFVLGLTLVAGISGARRAPIRRGH